MIAVICALDKELLALQKYLDSVKEIKLLNLTLYLGKMADKEVVLVKAGIGKAVAAATTLLVIKEYNPQMIITTGIAGGFLKSLKPLDIVIAENAVYYDVDMTCDEGMSFRYGEIQGAPFPFNSDQRALDILKNLDDGSFRYGTIATADIFQNKRDGLEKLQKEAFGEFSILAVDMETAAIMHIASITNTKVIALRAISDVIGMPSQISNFYHYVDEASQRISAIVNKLVSKI